MLVAGLVAIVVGGAGGGAGGGDWAVAIGYLDRWLEIAWSMRLLQS
jgi:hypothetical protein